MRFFISRFNFWTLPHWRPRSKNNGNESAKLDYHNFFLSGRLRKKYYWRKRWFVRKCVHNCHMNEEYIFLLFWERPHYIIGTLAGKSILHLHKLAKLWLAARISFVFTNICPNLSEFVQWLRDDYSDVGYYQFQYMTDNWSCISRTNSDQFCLKNDRVKAPTDFPISDTWIHWSCKLSAVEKSYWISNRIVGQIRTQTSVIWAQLREKSHRSQRDFNVKLSSPFSYHCFEIRTDVICQYRCARLLLACVSRDNIMPSRFHKFGAKWTGPHVGSCWASNVENNLSKYEQKNMFFFRVWRKGKKSGGR